MIELASPDESNQDIGRFGVAVKGLSDLTGDGIGELAVTTTENVDDVQEAGSVYIFNGQDFSVVRRLVAPQPSPGSGLGWVLAEAPDMNGDKVPELIVASWLQKVYAFSGASGEVLKTIVAPDTLDPTWARAAAALASTRPNSVPTLAVSSPGFGQGGGRIHIFNLITRELLFTARNPSTRRWFGASLATLGDVDADGRDDLIVGAGSAVSSGGNPRVYFGGGAYVLSGETGKLLYELIPPQPARNTFTWAVDAVPDVNGDGKMDVLVGIGGGAHFGAPTQSGHAYLFSGADGKPLRSLVSPDATKGGGFGWSVAGVPDVTGDGAGELLVGAASNPFYFGGDPFDLKSWGERKMYLISGRTGEILQSFVPPSGDDINGGAGEYITVLRGRNGRLRNLIAGVPRENDRRGRVFAFSPCFLAAALSAQGVRLSLTATDEKHYELQSSLDLKEWKTVATLKAAAEPVTFILAETNESNRRFYRAERTNTAP